MGMLSYSENQWHISVHVNIRVNVCVSPQLTPVHLGNHAVRIEKNLLDINYTMDGEMEDGGPRPRPHDYTSIVSADT